MKHFLRIALVGPGGPVSWLWCALNSGLIRMCCWEFVCMTAKQKERLWLATGPVQRESLHGETSHEPELREKKKFKYCWSSRLFEKIKACTPHNLWFDILRSNREISQGLAKQTRLKKNSKIFFKNSVDCSHQQCSHVQHDRDLLAFQAITTREIDLGCRTEEQWTSDCYCQCIIGSACSSGKQAFNVQRRLS